MPVSSAQKEANRKRNLAEARALLQSGKRPEELESKHQTALKRAEKGNTSKFSKVQVALPESNLKSDKSKTDVDSSYSKMSSLLHSYGQPFAALGRQSRNLTTNPRAINQDDTHHAQMGTLGDYLHEKLDSFHDTNALPSRQAKHIDEALKLGHDNLEKSNIAHDRGDVSGAKHHMTRAGESYYSAAVQMHSRGLPIKMDAHKLATSIASAYVTSTTPGVGAAPHENFVQRKVTPQYKTSKEESAPKATGKDYSRLSKSFEGFTPDINTSHYDREAEATTSSVQSQQIRNYMDGRY